jgi:hypothetical protein
MARKPYNGHPSWNAWNVSLWIGNDEPLYRFALECLERPTPNGHKPTLALATQRFVHMMGEDKTPDGARYSRTSVRHALAGLRE